MKGITSMLGLILAMGVVQRAAATQLSASALTQRQVAACMNKQMAASRTLSYIQASKVCKELVKRQGENLTANATPKPSGGR